MTFQNLLVVTDDSIATVTINRPQALNALNAEVISELEMAISALQNDEAVRVIILTGAGEKSFVAGADIKAMAQMSASESRAFAHAGQRTVSLMQQGAKPIIAAANGFALGGGLELALACDFIYASAKAKFGLPEVGLGVIPGFGGTQNLTRRIGAGRAKELIFTGRVISAEKALAWGIVNEVCPPEALLATVLDVAREIATKGPLAVSRAKEAVQSGANMALDDAYRLEAALFGTLFATDDQREGMNAFIEKRPATFVGK
ncbi:enoyl-CoA hydratase/isomerase family protein [Chrysiogenes arsenatis]|uniref:enoyl-CoA hydratase/isomerase family protein n=1 Tax=Chrysiogenes arsenatis TaxID=309797 RepID=UPI00040C5CB6|nr:enoyl-CoA hydratase-related protein [Chrysiogenes arsenatis]